jgi:hypothetical protein
MIVLFHVEIQFVILQLVKLVLIAQQIVDALVVKFAKADPVFLSVVTEL